MGGWIVERVECLICGHRHVMVAPVTVRDLLTECSACHNLACLPYTLPVCEHDWVPKLDGSGEQCCLCGEVRQG